MPKRPLASIDEDFNFHGRQMKMHVSPKEVDQGALSSTNMKSVYSKTMAMLFNASKQYLSSNVILNPPPANEATAAQDHDSRFTQLHISNSGKLVQWQENRTHCEPSLNQTSQCFCPSCKAANCVMFDRCSFCENFNCSSCLHTCRGCDRDYCTQCCIVLYNPAEVRLCLSCATEKSRY